LESWKYLANEKLKQCEWTRLERMCLARRGPKMGLSGEPTFTGKEEPKELMRRRGMKCRRVKMTQGGMSFQSKGVAMHDKQCRVCRIKTGNRPQTGS
jgi:hypothetical protein